MNAVTVLAPQTRFLDLLTKAVALHGSLVTIRLEGGLARSEIMAAGSMLACGEFAQADCPALLAAAFELCDGESDYQYGESRSAKMTGGKIALPAGVTMVLVQFFPARDGQRHLVARLSYDSDTCCGTCGG